MQRWLRVVVDSVWVMQRDRDDVHHVRGRERMRGRRGAARRVHVLRGVLLQRRRRDDLRGDDGLVCDVHHGQLLHGRQRTALAGVCVSMRTRSVGTIVAVCVRMHLCACA